MSLAIARDSTVWVAGQSYIARLNPGQTWQLYLLVDNPLLLNRFRFVILDDEDRPWVIGRQGKIHFDSQSWITYDAGGYIGLQFINPDWLRLTLQTLRAEGLDDTFDRLFFVPHLYGLNHPPEYDQDINGCWGFAGLPAFLKLKSALYR